jgi:hypothetical protein
MSAFAPRTLLHFALVLGRRLDLTLFLRREAVGAPISAFLLCGFHMQPFAAVLDGFECSRMIPGIRRLVSRQNLIFFEPAGSLVRAAPKET